MLTTVSLGTRRSSRGSYDMNAHRWPHQTPQPHESPKVVRLLQNDLFYESNDMTITDNSSKSVLNLLREIRTKRELKLLQNDWRKSDSNISELKFLNKKKSKLYERKYKVYRFFNKPNTFWAFIYHIMVFILVLTCLILTVLSTTTFYQKKATQILMILEKIIIVWFCNEFFLRLWSASCKQRYDGWRGKFAYMRKPSHFLDFIIIIASAAILISGTKDGNEVFAVSAFRGFHRLFQVFQILTLKRQIQPWKLLKDVMYDQMHQLLIIVYIEFISIFILAYLSYMLEKDAPNNQFSNLGEAMWWAVVTLSTVGYGDKVHVTWWGKLVSSLFTLLGVALFSLPAGIIGAGLAIRVEKEDSDRERKKRTVAATVLIQALWRTYKANQSTVNNNNNYGNKLENNINVFVLNTMSEVDRIVLKFIRLTQLFVAKRKFKAMLKVFDLDNAFRGYKFNQLDVNNGIKEIDTFVDTIDKRVDYNESQIFRTESNLEKRLENICSLIDYIETELSRQNTLIKFISLNITKQNNLSKLDQLLNNSYKRHNSVMESETCNKSIFYSSTCTNIDDKHKIT